MQIEPWMIILWVGCFFVGQALGDLIATILL